MPEKLFPKFQIHQKPKISFFGAVVIMIGFVNEFLIRTSIIPAQSVKQVPWPIYRINIDTFKGFYFLNIHLYFSNTLLCAHKSLSCKINNTSNN